MQRNFLSQTAFIIQARMTSTRLPGKILLPVLGKPLLELQIERLRRVRSDVKIIIATTKNDSDQCIVDFSEKNQILLYRGSETDVLSRYYEAASKYEVKNIIRITSDCPLIDPEVIDQLIETYRSEDDIDYASNTLIRTYPRGMDAEIFAYTALEKAFYFGKSAFQREHVTPYIYQNPDIFKLKNQANLKDLSEIRLTVDTREDFELIMKVYEYLYPQDHNFGLQEIVKLFEVQPDLLKINAHIEQKKN